MPLKNLQSLLLAGEAALYKGERSYVHGSSLIPEIEKCLGGLFSEAFLTEITFRKPLKNHGLIILGTNLVERCDLQCLAASGKYFLSSKEHNEFVICETPIKIEGSRPFDEAELANHLSFSSERKSVSLDLLEGYSFAEHVSASMKKLCQDMLPQHGKWFWGAFKKSGKLPSNPKHLKIETRKVIMNRFVSAQIIVDNEVFGTCDFVGSAT